MQVKAKDMDQGQLALFRFQYEISKCCGSIDHEIIWFANSLRPNIDLQRQSFSKIKGLTKI